MRDILISVNQNTSRILSEILTEWGMTDVKYELIKNLLKEDEEEDKKYFQ